MSNPFEQQPAAEQAAFQASSGGLNAGGALTRGDYQAFTQRTQAPGGDGPPMIIIPGMPGADRQQGPIGQELQHLGSELHQDVTDEQRQAMVNDLRTGQLSRGSLNVIQNLMQGAAETGEEARMAQVLTRVLQNMIQRGAESAQQLGVPFRTQDIGIVPINGNPENAHGQWGLMMFNGQQIRGIRLRGVGRSA